jgi:SAM-dependent methyltransferase
VRAHGSSARFSQLGPYSVVNQMQNRNPGSWRLRLLVAVVASVLTAACEQPAQGRRPDVRFEPTPHPVVAQMLELARVGPEDVVFDLGCGDGRIVIAAVKDRGARGVCVDIDPKRIRESRANAGRAGVAERIVFLREDLLETKLEGATVVTLFLSPEMNLKLRPKLRSELAPGTRVVSYVHGMEDWRPQEARTVEGFRGPRKLFLWVIPKQLSGGG